SKSVRCLQAQAPLLMPESVSVILPEPISSNRYWRTHGHTTYRTRDAKAYCEAVAMLTAHFRRDGAPCFPTGDVSCVVVWHRSAKRGRSEEHTSELQSQSNLV